MNEHRRHHVIDALIGKGERAGIGLNDGEFTDPIRSNTRRMGMAVNRHQRNIERSIPRPGGDAPRNIGRPRRDIENADFIGTVPALAELAEIAERGAAIA